MCCGERQARVLEGYSDRNLDKRNPCDQWCTQEFFSVGVQQIQLRTEERENGDLGVVAP